MPAIDIKDPHHILFTSKIDPDGFIEQCRKIIAWRKNGLTPEQLLGIEDLASADVQTIKKSFKLLALRFHPDKAPDKKEAAEAFSVLKDAHVYLLYQKGDLSKDVIKNNPFNETDAAIEEKYRLLIHTKLLPLIGTYFYHLVNDPIDRHVDVKTKKDIARQLVRCLVDDYANDLDIKASQRVYNFYRTLDAGVLKLQAHRDHEWILFVRNTLIVAGILLTGILPGLIALAVYANTGITEMKSCLFWRSKGANVVDKLMDERPDVSMDMEHNIPNQI